MSKFTTELRHIIDTIGTGDTIDARIQSAAPQIFDDTWTTEDPAYKSALEFKILRHFYMREIGAETYALWKLQLNTTLAEIMPKYNLFYSNLQSVQDKLLSNVNVTESQDLKSDQKTNANSETNDTSSSSGKSSGKNTSTGSNTGSSDADAWQEYNDTPQGSLQNIQNGTYLTNATRNRSNNSTKADNTNTADSSTENSSESTAHSTGTSSGSANTTENYVKTIIGKNSGTEYIDAYQKLVSGYNDIDMMIINDLNICFINLWE